MTNDNEPKHHADVLVMASMPVVCKECGIEGTVMAMPMPLSELLESLSTWTPKACPECVANPAKHSKPALRVVAKAVNLN
jgi:hypothetical protein